MAKKARRGARIPRGVVGDRQLDLLVALPGDIPTHDQQDMMERPFFSLSKQRRTEPIDYQVQNGATTVSVNVTAPVEIGIATIWDADVLIWAASQLREAKARGLPTSPAFKVSIYELLRGIDRRTGGDEYQRIVEAFERLSGTLIRTNIRQGRRKVPEGFHWIERYAAPTDEEGRPAGVEFTIADWLYEGILTDRLTLTIDREYFKLTGGIERWLYRVVRKHGGHQSGGWAFTMAQLHHKRVVARSGSRTLLKSCAAPSSGNACQAIGYSSYATQKVRRFCTSPSAVNSRRNTPATARSGCRVSRLAR